MAVATHTNAGQRRLVYGLNVFIGIIAALALTVLVIWLGDRFSLRSDLTRSGSSSLSPRTRQVVGQLDQKVTVTGMYTVISKYMQHAQKRKDAVRDMLALFESSSRGNVTAAMIDPLEERKELEALLKRIREKPAYQNESQPHREAVERAAPLIADLSKLATEDTQAMQNLAQTDERLTRSREFVIIANSFALLVGPTAEELAQRVQTAQEGEIPRYGRAVEALRSTLPQIRTALEEARGWFAGSGAKLTDISATSRDYFRNTAERYGALIGRIDDLLRDIEPLKPVKLDQVADALNNAVNSPPIIVETAQEARVVPFDEVWEFRQEEVPAGEDDRLFNGEEAILSAIMGLTAKDKVGVVFVRHGGESPIRPDFARFQPGQPPPTAPYIQLSQRLEKLNFSAADWDLATSKTPPAQDGVSRTIYVVLPPTPPPPQNPMRPQPPPPSLTPEDKQKIYEAIAAGGAALFLAESTTQRGPGEPYAFAEHLRTQWGIDVKSVYLTLAFDPNPNKPGVFFPTERGQPLLRSDAFGFTDHPIGKPLGSSVLALYNAAPLAQAAGEGVPNDTNVRTVIEARGEDVWAINDWYAFAQEVNRNQGAVPNDATLRAPFPLMMTAQKDKTRIAVIGSTDFARDAIAQARGIAPTPTGFARVLLFPGNTDLFTNTLFWLLGDEGRIAIGTRSGDVPRLDKLKAGPAANFWKGFLVAGMPLLALVVGGAVALARRR